MHGRVICINGNYVVTKYYKNDTVTKDWTFIKRDNHYYVTDYINGVVQLPIRQLDEYTVRRKVMEHCIYICQCTAEDKEDWGHNSHNYVELRKKLNVYQHWSVEYFENLKTVKQGNMQNSYQQYLKSKKGNTNV